VKQRNDQIGVLGATEEADPAKERGPKGKAVKIHTPTNSDQDRHFVRCGTRTATWRGVRGGRGKTQVFLKIKPKKTRRGELLTTIPQGWPVLISTIALVDGGKVGGKRRTHS